MTLRVLMTLDAVGGVWRYAMDLGKGLRARGHRVVFAGLGPRPSGAQRAEAAAIGPLEWGEAPLDWMGPDESAIAPVAPWIDALVRRHRPDLLHLNLPSQAVGLQSDVPAIVVCHSCLATWFRAVQGRAVPAESGWLARRTGEGLSRAAVAIAPSAAHARLTETVYGVTGIAHVLNGSGAAQRPPSAGDGGAVAVARWWDPGKDGATLDAAATLAPMPVTMIGACDAGPGRQFAARHAIAAGALAHDATLARVAGASVFVSPSVYEPFGLAALEAARLGRPLLLADIPVYRELWKGAARFFAPRDAGALAGALRELAQDPDARRRLGAAAQARARTYSAAAQIRAMETACRRVLPVEMKG